MRIHDSDNDKVTDNVTLYLTSTEAQELIDDLAEVLSNPKGNHAHISSANYQQELTVCIYNLDDLDEFDDRSKAIIRGN